MEIPSLLEMLKAGVHYGHRTSKWHASMKPYVFTARDGVHIIDLEKTAEKLKEALDLVKEIAAGGGVILFLGTKRQAREIVKKYAKECEMPYIIERWLGGTFTNFSVISKLVKKLKDLRKKKETGEFNKYTKKEQLEFQREMERLENLVGGIENMENLPKAIYIIDAKEEQTAVREARRTKVPIIALTDTNVDASKIDYVIPSNDDATKTIELMTSLIAGAVKEGKGKKVEKEKPRDKKQINPKLQIPSSK